MPTKAKRLKIRKQATGAVLISLGMVALMLTFATPTQAASPGQVPTPFTFTAVNGKITINKTAPVPFAINLAHPGAPSACSDTISNETPGMPDVDDGVADAADAQCVAPFTTDDDEKVITTTAQNAAFPATLNQPKTNWTFPGTRTGNNISLPTAGLVTPVAYERIHQAGTPHVDADVAAKVVPIAFGVAPPGTSIGLGCNTGGAAWVGTSLVSGQGTLTGCAYLDVNIEVTACSPGIVCGIGGVSSGSGHVCRTNSFPLTMTTETSGTLSGTRYDTARKNAKLVDNTLAIGNLAKIAGSTTLCNSVMTTLGLPSTTVGNNEAEFILSTETGAPTFPPVAAVANQIVNEGSVVTMPGVYDPAMRTGTTTSASVTSGPTPVVIDDNTYSTNGGFVEPRYVAPDAPSAGVNQDWSFNITAPAFLNGVSQSASDTATITVNNVAPSNVNAGPDQAINAGSNVVLKGTSIDPGDPDLTTDHTGDADARPERGYCWTKTGGSATGVTDPPACTGSAPTPLNNGKTLTLPTTAGASGTVIYTLTVQDDDLGTGPVDTVTVEVRPAATGRISGSVDDSAGADLAGVTVDLMQDGAGYITSTTTNASGYYEFNGLTNGATGYHVRYNKALYMQTWNGNAKYIGTSPDITVPNNAVDGDLYLASSFRQISGVVTADVGGALLNGIDVRVYDETGWVGTTTTNVSGAYSFPFLEPKATYKVDFSKPTGDVYLEEWNSNAITANGANLVNVTAGNQTVNAGLAVAAGGTSTIGGTVVGVGGPTPGNLAGVEVRIYKSTGGWVKSGTTDVAGVYSVPGLLPGSYTVWFWEKTSGYYSEWHTDLRGEQYDGTGQLANVLTVVAGSGLPINASLAP